MKKTILIIGMFIVIVLGVVGCKKKSDDEKENIATSENIVANTSIVDTSNDTDINIETPTSLSESFDSEAGGNPEQNVINTTDVIDKLEVTVSVDKYYVDNHEISYDDLLNRIGELDKEDYVVLYDEKSTLKAFNKIKDYLEENKILYEIN